MKDITLLGVDYSDVPSVVLPKTGGGTAKFIDMDVDLGWMGPNPAHVGTIYSQTYTLDQTEFDTWTPSTTAKVIVATGAVSQTQVVDLEHYEYLVRWRCDFRNALNTGATKKAQIDVQTASHWQHIHRRPYGLANIETMTDTRNYCTNMFGTSTLLVYWNTSGTKTWTTTNSYGIYQTYQAATFNNNSTTPTVTFNYPSITARCYSSYFATARAAEVDKANATVKLRGDLYRFDKGYGWARHWYKDAYEMYADPL